MKVTKLDADLVLFLTSDSPRSQRARANLADAVREQGLDGLEVSVIDLVKHPAAAVQHGVFATPALMRAGTSDSASVLYGDLSDHDRLTQFLSGMQQARH